MAWIKVGTIRKSKKGGLYLKVEADVTLAKDAALQIQDPRTKIKDAIAAGKMSESQGTERLAKLPEWLSKDVFLVTEE